MAKRYDVVVVGAGPAGMTAAKTAAENGLKVALLERKTDIPKIHRVDGGVFGINEYTFGQMVTLNPKLKRLCFVVSGFSVPYDGPYCNLYGFQIHTPGGKRVLVGDWEEVKKKGDEVRLGISINKEALLKGSRASGVVAKGNDPLFSGIIKLAFETDLHIRSFLDDQDSKFF